MDESTGRPGEAVCKGCWESSKTKTSAGLETVWVSVDGENLALWLCAEHAATLDQTVEKKSPGAARPPFN